MITLALSGCPLQPLSSYLKALGVLRLLSEQLNPTSIRGSWGDDYFVIESDLDHQALIDFFLSKYRPSSVLAPWNGGSGFYLGDRKDGISAILDSTDPRFEQYRYDIQRASSIVETIGGEKGTGKADEHRRKEILRECRNQLSDTCVDWLDAAIAISADGSRAFAPILGTGGNEGRLDYTNNFMGNVSGLLNRSSKLPIRSLLENALFGSQTSGFQDLAIGQYDPGRSGGFNQGNGIESRSAVNPWNAVLMIEGAIAWAGGIYRKQGVSFKSILCSPFTVRPSAVGFGSAADKDEKTARAEIWTPLWHRPALYGEIRALLREGRAAVNGRPSSNGLQFAEAAASLGVDRAISRFVRYSMLKRRGDSYIAMPAGQFPVKFQTSTENVREAAIFLEDAKRAASSEGVDSTNAWQSGVRSVHEAMFEALLHGEQKEIIQLARAIGRVNHLLLTRGIVLPRQILKVTSWVLNFESRAEGRIAAAIASVVRLDTARTEQLLQQTLSPASKCWTGRNLSERMLTTLDRRSKEEQGQSKQLYRQTRSASLSDVSQFLQGSLDDDLIEDLLFSLAIANIPHTKETSDTKGIEGCRLFPAYCLVKQLFTTTNPKKQEAPKLLPDISALSLLRAGRAGDAANIAIRRLRIAGINPFLTKGYDSPNALRIAAALLIPISKIDVEHIRRLISKPETKDQDND
jgi:CRISPR-associated protein Csx17